MNFDTITTKTGDTGKSSLYDGRRLSKDESIFEALGTCDELNSWLGLIKHFTNSHFIKIETVQEKLFFLASTLATSADSQKFSTLRTLHKDDVEELEEYEKELISTCSIPKTFVLPGKKRDSAQVDIARTVCRRFERRLVLLTREPYSMQHLATGITYINRLSDYLFLLARHLEL